MKQKCDKKQRKDRKPEKKHMKKYENILFDLDGTLIDSSKGIFASLRYAFEKARRKIPSEKELYRFIGPPLNVSFSEFCGMNEEQTEQAEAFYREYYSTDGIRMYSLYAGVADMLRELSAAGKRLFLATSKPEIFAREILADAGVLDYFTGICGSDPANGRNSKSEVLLCLLSIYTMIPADTVMVGDRKYDAVGASDAGLDFIGVLWGFGDSAELSEYAPVLMPASCNELVRALLL